MEEGNVDENITKSEKVNNIARVESTYYEGEGVVTAAIFSDVSSLTNTAHRDSPTFKVTTFNDGIRSVDFILVWDEQDLYTNTNDSKCKREVYEKNLRDEGLELEYEACEDGSGLHFIKIHVPIEVLRRYGEILKLRLPMREELCVVTPKAPMKTFLQSSTFISEDDVGQLRRSKSRKLKRVKGFFETLMDKLVYVDKEVFPDKGHRFTAIYSRDKEYLFPVESKNFFSPAVRSRVVQFILDRTFFAEPLSHDVFVFGIERLLDSLVYNAAYPLHDGDGKRPGSMRYSLSQEWACMRKCYRYQPLDYIKEYFGVKIGLYFAWLGFYTNMLVPASLVGLICFIYSCFTLPSFPITEDICSRKVDVKMCPQCDKFCGYWDLKDTCTHARVTYLFDNPTTVFFAVFMSFWAALFLELWKRYSAEMTHRWDLTGWDTQEEQPRPQYLARLERLKSHQAKTRLNVVTGVVERRVPFWTVRFPATILSFSIVLLLVALALAAVLGVVLYRMSVLAALSMYGDSVISSYAILFTTATAATINLTCIVIFNWIYSWLAEYLTELEMLRTQTEFDDSLTLKMYLLQFVNYYASIFYIAFCKGKLVGFPGNYNRLFGFRQEECGPGGCLMELCIQLGIIMVGKQAVNTALEILMPIIYTWWRRKKINRQNTKSSGSPRWIKDYKLVEWGHRALFPEYLEMILQYGFVTIFVAAFPLAPLFALINNVMEMRLDAMKLLTYHRKPVAQRVRNIGVWYRILDSVSKLAVVTNGFIIGFTSDFIPRLVYRVAVSEDGSLNGFLNHSLSFMDARDLDMLHPPNSTEEYCRYPDYREPPWSPDKYEKTSMFWTVLTARLVFVVIFENVVVLVVLMVQWCIPDIPGRLKEQIRREAFITNEIIIHQEAARSKEGGESSSLPTTPILQPPPLPPKPRSKVWTQSNSGMIKETPIDLDEIFEVQNILTPEMLMLHPSNLGEIYEEAV